MLQAKKVLITNPKVCIGCRSCEVFCSYRHYGENNPARAFIKIIKVEEEGLDIPVICRHCDRAPCITACPVNAIVRDDKTGAVVISQEVCIGCRSCVSACPFGAITIDPKTEEVAKCDLCGGDPACAKVCPTRAITYVRGDVAARLLARSALKGLYETLAKEMRPIYA